MVAEGAESSIETPSHLRNQSSAELKQFFQELRLATQSSQSGELNPIYEFVEEGAPQYQLIEENDIGEANNSYGETPQQKISLRPSFGHNAEEYEYGEESQGLQTETLNTETRD